MSSKAPADPALATFLAEELGLDLREGESGARPSPSAAKPGWQVTAPMWLWRGNAADGTPTKAAWYFITIAGEVAESLRASAKASGVPRPRGSWGSVRVSATIGATCWQTSVFPSKDVGGFVLPVKAAVRKSEKMLVDQLVTLRLVLA
jgi:hypothetical protein